MSNFETTSIIMNMDEIDCDEEEKRANALRARMDQVRAKRKSRGLRRDTEALRRLKSDAA